jgi:hypothetical protein
MEDREIRAALDQHWAASDANDFEAEHRIYQEDAVLEYPQSGERISGRHNIQASRFAQPNKKRFTVRRILGIAGLWITELILTYDGQPSYTVSIMEFRDGKVSRETQYFGDPFEPGARYVQEELENDRPLPREIVFEASNVSQAFVPDFFADQRRGQLLRFNISSCTRTTRTSS